MIDLEKYEEKIRGRMIPNDIMENISELVDRLITAEAKLKEYKEDYKWCLNEFADCDEPMTEGALCLKQALLATERAITAEKAVDILAKRIELSEPCMECRVKSCNGKCAKSHIDWAMEKAREANATAD